MLRRERKEKREGGERNISCRLWPRPPLPPSLSLSSAGGEVEGYVRHRLFFFLLPPFSPSVLGYPREIYRPAASFSFPFPPFPQLFSQAKQRGRKRRQFLIFWEELHGLSDRAGEFVP